MSVPNSDHYSVTVSGGLLTLMLTDGSAAIAGGCVKTLFPPEVELGRVHRHIELGSQYVEIHRRSG